MLFCWPSLTLTSSYSRSFPNFFNQYVKDCGVNGFKTMRCSLRFMGICEERQRQGPSHPVMYLHRNSQHSNLNITLTSTVACFDFKFPFLYHLGVDAISCFFFLFCFCSFVFCCLFALLQSSYSPVIQKNLLVFWPHRVWHDILVGDNYFHI